MDPDFEELSNDVDLIARIKQFRESRRKIADCLKCVDNPELYDTLSNADKIKYNLLMSFGMNTLFWMYLRVQGVDPTTHQIRGENERLKQSMARSQQIKDRKTIMPRLNVPVAKRFIKSGLWTPGNATNACNENGEQDNEPEEDWDKPVEDWDKPEETNVPPVPETSRDKT